MCGIYYIIAYPINDGKFHNRLIQSWSLLLSEYISCDNIENHIRNEYFSRSINSAIQFISEWTYAVRDNIDNHTRDEYFSGSIHSAVEFTSE